MRLAIRSCSLSLILGLAAACGPSQPPPPSQAAPFSVVEASIADMQAAMRDGRTTSKEIVTQYLTRIATYEDAINAVIQVNPKALEDAEARDRERAEGKIRGPLAGTAHSTRSRTPQSLTAK